MTPLKTAKNDYMGDLSFAYISCVLSLKTGTTVLKSFLFVLALAFAFLVFVDLFRGKQKVPETSFLLCPVFLQSN